MRQQSHQAEETTGQEGGAWQAVMTCESNWLGNVRNQYTHPREKPRDRSEGRRALNQEHGEVTKVGSNSVLVSGNHGMPRKTTYIFCSSTAAGLQGEVPLLSLGSASVQDACQHGQARGQGTDRGHMAKGVYPSFMMNFCFLFLSSSHVAEKGNGPGLFTHGICVSSPSKKAWG